MKTKTSIYEQVTNSLIETIEQGCPAWRKPWSVSTRKLPLRSCSRPYQGINVLILWVATMAKGYTSPYWLTFKQVRNLGGHVRKGERATTICYYSTFAKKVERESGETEEKNIPFLKAYWVFNADQCDNLPMKYHPTPTTEDTDRPLRIDAIESFISSLNANVRHHDIDRAIYNRTLDLVSVPHIQNFIDPEHYYGTLFHELIHWTGHESRLDRKMGNTFGSEDYAQEELVAELGAAFLCAHFNFGNVTREDHAAYLQNWLQALKSDKKFIFKAASHAQKGSNFLQKLANKSELLAA